VLLQKINPISINFYEVNERSDLEVLIADFSTLKKYDLNKKRRRKLRRKGAMT